MPVLYKPTEHAFHTEGPPLTEQEHKNSCDINKMIKAAHRGLPVRGGYAPQYGFDDLTMDAVQLRIQKQELEENLSEFAQKEFTQKEFDLIPKEIRDKFGYRVKQDPPAEAVLNDDKTTSSASSKQGIVDPTPTQNRATTARLGGQNAD